MQLLSMLFIRRLFFVFALLMALSCHNSNDAQSNKPPKALKEYYHDFFPVGVSVSPASLRTAEAKLVEYHFNSITPENVMKMGRIHPKENEYYWKEADSIVAFAKRHKMKIRGHTLVWHQEVPDWFFKDASGNTVAKDVLLQRLKDHITNVVKRYKGDVYAWDVVNEAISNDADTFYRQSMFYKICGEAYIAKAFEWAHAADPGALLFYNDYNETDAVKRNKIIQMVQQLRAKGVPIHAIGLQAHWNIFEPSKKQLKETIEAFAATGLALQITELDVSIYPKELHPEQKSAKDFDNTFNAAMEEKQAKQYKMFFEVFRKNKQYITGVTFWNISDSHSWLDNFPIRNRKDHPLLFDENLRPKKAFYEVTDLD